MTQCNLYENPVVQTIVPNALEAIFHRREMIYHHQTMFPMQGWRIPGRRNRYARRAQERSTEPLEEERFWRRFLDENKLFAADFDWFY